MKTLLQIIVVIALVVLTYTYYQNKKVGVKLDVSKYEKQIDSLNGEIKNTKQQFQKLDSLNKVQEQKINKLNNKLSKIADEAAKEHKQHEKDINHIAAMSDNDVAALFTKSFK